jgi:Ser/Thr protein kinase RdoA (MazF antagonist)
MSAHRDDLSEFAGLSTRGQVRRLRLAAFEVLSHWPIEVRRLRLVYHGFNCTFRVDATDGRTFSLRLSVSSRKSAEALRAEMAWLDALAAESEVRVPVPQHTVDGASTAEVFVPSLGRSLPAAMFSWLYGPNVESVVTPKHVTALGRAMAQLHTHAEHWALPPGAALPSTDVYWGPEFPLLAATHPLFGHERRALYERVADHARQVSAELSATGPHHALHADLHLGNVKWWQNRLSVFDFDDALVGVRHHDLAISTYYLRPRQDLVDALSEGYASVRSLPEMRTDQFETLLAARNVLLIHDVLTTESAEIAAILPQFLANSDIRQRHFLDTGEFRHDLPGVIPLG